MGKQQIKYRPILFSTPMVKALDQRIKSQTRRLIKLPTYHPSMIEKQTSKQTIVDGVIYDGNQEIIGTIKFPNNVGDVFWVRETFHKNVTSILAGTFCYKAIFDPFGDFKWEPSIFMPKEACRIFLKIKDIRIERLNDISEEDAINEGILFVDGVSKKLYYNYQTIEYGFNAIDSYMSLWEKINGKDSWGTNPYVFVYEFEHIEKPLDFK